MPQSPRDAHVTYHPLVVVFASVVSGSVVDRLWAWPWQFELIAAATMGGLWLRIVYRRRCPALGWLIALGFFSAAFAHHATWRLASCESLDLRTRRTPAPILLEATILSMPFIDESIDHSKATSKAKLLAKATRLRDGQQWHPTSGIFEMTVTLSDAANSNSAPTARRTPTALWTPGDSIRVHGEIRTHWPPMNPGDWNPLLSRRTRRQTLLRVGSVEAVELLRPAPWWSPRRRLSDVRQSIESCLRRHVPRSQADLSVALLLGRRECLSFSERRLFIHSGTSHLLALSGLHVGLLASLVWLAGRAGWLSRVATCVAAGATGLAYLAIAGPRPSLVRATILIVAVAAARWMGRPRAVWNTLALAALALIVCDPSQVFDTGAQLSFLAVAALCRWGGLTAPPPSPLQRLIDSAQSSTRRATIKILRGLRHWMLLSAVVWMITAPIAAWRFGMLAPIGILLNPFAGPLVAAALYGAVTTNVLGPWPSAASLAGALTGRLLAVLQHMAHWGADVPGGHWLVAPPSALWAAAGCGLWLGWAVSKQRPTRIGLAICTSLWCAWGIASQMPQRNSGLTVTVLSVGHGSCIVIRTPKRRVWVYDAGRMGGGRFVQRVLSQCMALQRDKQIHGLVLSHEDADHYNAVELLLQSTHVHKIFVGPRMLDESRDNEPGVAALIRAIKSADVAVAHIHQPGVIEIEPGVTLEVLHPPAQWNGRADNADSLVMRLAYRGRAVLLTGDAEGPGLDRLLRMSVQADVVLAPHHGSPHSYPAQVADWCRARWMLVSSGHIRKELHTMDAHVLQTARDGALQVRIDRAGLTVSSFIKEGGFD